MANEQNLVRGDEAHKLTAEEASKGGKASAEARREKRDLRKALEMLLETEVAVTNKATGEVTTMTGTQALTKKLFEQGMKGNIKAFIAIRETVGQDPVQKIEVSQTDPAVVAEVEEMVFGKDES